MEKSGTSVPTKEIYIKLKLIDDCRKGWTARNGKYWAKSENIS